jgi:pimeloyl-ACP methyl ester carboxylesterase
LTRSRTRRIRTAAAVVIATLVAVSCGAVSTEDSSTSSSPTTIANGSFYATPSTVPTGAPGTGAAPAGGRPVVSWAHPTTGIDDSCAPSLQPSPYDSIMGLSEFLAQGWVVVATDYEGLGTDGVHPYLVGASEAHGVIDIVRAAHQMTQVGASTRFATFGHSQGGQAALFTGQLAAQYAPDLQLVAVAAAAPSGDLAMQFDQKGDTEAYSYIGSYLTTSWADVFGARPDTAVAPASVVSVRSYAAKCVVGGTPALDASLNQIFDVDPAVSPSMWLPGFDRTDPWSSLIGANSAGSAPIAVPTLVTQGTADTVIPPDTTARLVAAYRANGTPVTEQLLDGVPHTLAGYKSVPLVVPFFSGLAG